MEKERLPFPEERVFLLCTAAESERVLVFIQGRNLSTFVGLHYHCQTVLACKPSFYIGMMKYHSAATALSPNGYTNFPHLILN